ncbi:BON domain-containing protein [Nonomuraea sp. NPDC051941]|uniref:BON domain-containing protein n=1 Tax=Nonomuraea sp. NPDC051941 TaxID=3364373 RepID=UPI0037CBC721
MNDRTRTLIEVRNGRVTLFGYTSTWADAIAPVHLAQGLGSVPGVDDDLAWKRDDLLGRLIWDRS